MFLFVFFKMKLKIIVTYDGFIETQDNDLTIKFNS